MVPKEHNLRSSPDFHLHTSARKLVHTLASTWTQGKRAFIFDHLLLFVSHFINLFPHILKGKKKGQDIRSVWSKALEERSVLQREDGVNREATDELHHQVPPTEETAEKLNLRVVS